MDEWKIYFTSAVFVGVTILKLLFPSHTEQVRTQMVALIDMDMDYRDVVTQVGALLTDDSVQQVLSEVDVILPTETEAPSPVPSEEETDVQNTIPSSVLSAVEAFRLAQEAYEDYETPENVSYDSLYIPFSYSAPVEAVLSSGFGYRVHPIDQVVSFHYGTDYDVEEGTAITSFADGTVTDAGEASGYGNYVEVTHADGWVSLYAHCSSILVSIGQEVTMGDVIAYSGQTGRVTGPHLHLELSHNGAYTNPEFFLP